MRGKLLSVFRGDIPVCGLRTPEGNLFSVRDAQRFP
jgi:hypothetical protein